MGTMNFKRKQFYSSPMHPLLPLQTFCCRLPHPLPINVKPPITQSRTLINNPSTIFPLSAIGLLTLHQTNGSLKFGTAVIVGRNVALTCAHNLWQKMQKREVLKVQFEPGRDGVAGKKIYQAKKWAYPKEFKSKDVGFQPYDYALIQFSEPFSPQHGKFGMNMSFQPFSSKSQPRVYLYGYPMDLNQQLDPTFMKMRMFGSSGNIKNINSKGMFQYSIETDCGMSGAALFVQMKSKPTKLSETNKSYLISKTLADTSQIEKQDEKAERVTEFRAIGIHVMGDGKSNIGVRITKKMMQELGKHLQEAQPFLSIHSFPLAAKQISSLLNESWQHLVRLSIRSCHLTDSAWANLSEKFPAIRKADLRKNALTKATISEKMKDIEFIDFSDNQITAIDPKLWKTSILDILILDNNSLSLFDPLPIQYHPLRYLSLFSNSKLSLPLQIPDKFPCLSTFLIDKCAVKTKPGMVEEWMLVWDGQVDLRIQ